MVSCSGFGLPACPTIASLCNNVSALHAFEDGACGVAPAPLESAPYLFGHFHMFCPLSSFFSAGWPHGSCRADTYMIQRDAVAGHVVLIQ